MVYKLTRDSPAPILLKERLESGQLTGNESPKQVWESDELFREHKLSNFRVHYHALRKEMGLIQDEKLQERLKRRCFVDTDDAAAKVRRTEVSPAENALEEVNQIQVESSLEYSTSEVIQSFNPLYLLSNWKEAKTLTQRLTVAVVLPSRVDSFSVRVSLDGKSLELTVNRPFPLVNLKEMHKKFLKDTAVRYETYHPEYIGFSEALKCFRVKSSDWVQSRAVIPLPCTVQSHIVDKHNMTWRDSCTKMVYIRLKSMVENYAIERDKNGFEVL